MVWDLDTLKRLNDEAAAKASSGHGSTLGGESRFVFRLYLGVYRGVALKAGLTDTLERHGHGGATITNATGVWQGETESTTVIEIWAPVDAFESIKAVGAELCRVHEQAAVGLTVQPAAVFLIEGSHAEA